MLLLSVFSPKFSQAAAVFDQKQCVTTPKHPRALKHSYRRDNAWRMRCHQRPDHCMVLHGHEATPQVLALVSSGRSKPNSLSEGTDNDVFIPYHKRCRSCSCLFAQVALCQAPGPGRPWKDGEGSCTGGLRQGTHIPVGDAILNEGTLFH